MRRRSVLGGVAALASLSGCSRILGSGAAQIRVMHVDRERAQRARASCTLSSSFLSEHPVLDRLLEAARDAPAGEWVTEETNRETGEHLLSSIEQYCKRDDPVYHYNGEAFVVRVEIAGTTSHAGAAGLNTTRLTGPEFL